MNLAQLIGKVDIVIYYWRGKGSVSEGMNGITKMSEMYESEGLYGLGCVCCVGPSLGAGVYLVDTCLSLVMDNCWQRYWVRFGYTLIWG